MLRGFLLAMCFLAAACSPVTTETESGSTWGGTITTEGNVTTVVNESGSVWGGTARLVEEASIGVEAGADELMFGRITSVWATDNEIYVVDVDVPAVRVYDRRGTWLGNIGRQGQGPGEYVAPFRVATRPDGAIFVSERPTKILVYSPTGENLDTWAWTSTVFSARQQLVVTYEGTLFLESIEVDGDVPTETQSRRGMQAVGPDGKSGELREFPTLDVDLRSGLTYLDGGLFTPLPFAARFVVTMLPSGEFAYGVGDTYSFTRETADGAQLIVERRSAPVEVLPAEREAHERSITARIRSRDPGWVWNGPPIRERKPAFDAFYASQDGRLLVRRKGEGERIETAECSDAPTPNEFIEARRQGREIPTCWRSPFIWDVFAADGRYLGGLDLPDMLVVADPFMSGETLVLAVEDDAGTIMVKRYRLVLPGEE